jgi:alpha-glucosidase
MLNLGLSGQPFATHDIAGFSGGPSTKELYQRWTELGAFSPFMRTHDGNDRENNHRWDSDEDTTAHFSRMARVHEALSAERIALAAEAAKTGLPLVRHLLIEFPDDAQTWEIHDQYLLGSELLVAPVLTEGSTSRSLYLPEGEWFHVWTGQAYSGPDWVEVPAPIGEPPVFSRGADRSDLRAIQ